MAVAEFSQNVKIISTKLPTFLQVLLREDANIRLMYCEKEILGINPVDASLDETIEGVENLQLELLGSPLRTDLGGNDSLNVSTAIEVSPSWAPSEVKYYPVSLSDARGLINKMLKNKEVTKKPVFCICDGNDPDKTLVLGAFHTQELLMRVLVQILPNLNDDYITIDHLTKDHSKNLTGLFKVDSVITDLHYLFGNDLKNCDSLDASAYNGSVALEVTQEGSEDVFKRTYKTMIQVINGHSASPLSRFWDEMSIIEHCIDLLGKPDAMNSPATRFSKHVLNCSSMELNVEIREALKSIKLEKEKCSDVLNFDNLRSKGFMDILWNIATRCGALGDLQSLFHGFFELMASYSGMLVVKDEDKSALSCLIDDLIKGNRAVPTLSYSQSLELLVEAGLDKLKNDYATIATHLYPIIEDIIAKTWGGFRPKTGSGTSHSRISKFKTRTRSTITPNCPATDMAMSKQKIAFLHKLHVICEFMLLSKEHLRSCESDFNHFATNLCNHFVMKKGNKHGSDFLTSGKLTLLEFESELNTFDSNLLRGEESSCQVVRLTSTIRSTTVTTIYHISKYPIFPPNIWDYHNLNQDVSLPVDDTIVGDETPDKYVTKLIQLQTCR